MKWLSGGGDGPIVATDMENGGNRGPQRSQDDAAVGYVFQRPPDPEFTQFDMKQGRWALGDDTIVENHDKWKYSINSKGATPTNSMSNMMQVTPGVYDALQAKSIGPEHLVYLPNQVNHVNMQGISMQHYMQQNCIPHHQQQQHQQQAHHQQQQQQQQSQLRNQIAPAAKKLWGLEGGKDTGKLALHPLNHEQVWQNATWSTPVEHAVSQPIAMSGRRSGAYPAGAQTGTVGGVSVVDNGGNILSPRGSDTGGLGVKMVEYVLGTSPTSKDSLASLEPRMRSLGLVGADGDKDKDKAASPLGKEENGVVMQNGNVPIQNGTLDDDKGFNRTPGSRQPSPAEEELTKNNLAALQHTGVVILKPDEHLQQLPAGYPHLGPPPHHGHGGHGQHGHGVHSGHGGHTHGHAPHGLAHGLAPGLTLSESVNQHFEHFDQQPGSYDPNPQHLAAAAAAAAAAAGTPSQYAPPPQQQVDNSVLQQQHNFDVQQLFRSQQNQALGQAAAAAAAAGQPTAAQAQLQLIQQQQYLAAQQQPLQTAAAFPQPQYVLNPQAPQEPGAPYVGTLIAGVPQYYGVAPWGVYPANIIQQGATNGARRPLTPSGSQEQPQVQGGYIVPYYDQNAPILMAQGAAMRNGTPMRLVSPAPVLVQPQSNRQTPAGASLYSSTPQSLYGATVNTSVNGGTLGGVTQAAVGVGSGLFPTLHAPPSAAAPFGSSSLGTIGSPATTNTSLQTGECGITGLGLNTSSTGRRDSFDRNTSAFSPSLEYRPKWPAASYGLGSSPSPLTGSLTPPPSAPLQLGGLVNSRVLSAAPGAEAKYRASTMATGLTANAMFGSTNSLFTKLNAAARPNLTTVTTSTLDKPQGRSRLLEDFRNNRFPNLQLRDLANHIVEFSQDQHGSRFIQQKLERATVTEKQLVFSEILSAAYNLMTDVFGNYVIQKFFEFGTPEQKTTLAQKVRGNVLPLALQMYGCRVIQKALESIGPEQQQEIVRELDGHVLKCVKDQNGNHVVQKCIECVEPNALQFIINSFSGQVYSLSTHPYGCRVIQRILEHCTPEQTAPILKELHAHTEQLIQDQFGNYVIQHVLEHGNADDKSQLIAGVRGKVLVLSQHKFASNVVEKCVTHATRAERALLIEEVCGFNDNALHVMMKDQYANYVVQKMIDVSEPTQRKVLMHKIRPHLNSLRKYTYGKHIIAKLEKFLMKSGNTMTGIGGNELGPIGPPANGVL